MAERFFLFKSHRLKKKVQKLEKGTAWASFKKKDYDFAKQEKNKQVHGTPKLCLETLFVAPNSSLYDDRFDHNSPTEAPWALSPLASG